MSTAVCIYLTVDVKMALAVVVTQLLYGVVAAEQSPPPNIVYFLVDDLG